MLTAEQLEIQQLAREFSRGEIRPYVEDWDAARQLPDEIFEKLAELGFLGMRLPERYGGLAFDTATYLTALEAMAWGDASVALTLSIHNGPVARVLLEHGSDEQKDRWLPHMASGQSLGAFVLSEEGAGSDPAAMECRARRQGEGWILDGAKAWVTNGDRADLLLVFARTGEGREGVSAFLVPRETEGIQTEGRERTLGLSASETVSLRFHEVTLPPGALLGEPGQGYAMAMDALVIGRLGVAAQALGIGQAAFEHALTYAGEREQFGRTLNEFGAIQEKLAEMAIRLAQARALTLEVAARTDGEAAPTGGLPSSLRAGAAMAKVAASQAAMWVADEAVQIFGGYGYMRDYPVERLMRDAKGTEIYEGANEVLRWIVARDTVKEADSRS